MSAAAARVRGSEVSEFGRLCLARGSNPERGGQAERWLANALPRSRELGLALGRAIGAPDARFPIASARGADGKKADVKLRALDGGAAWIVGVSCKLRTLGVGGPAWGNQIARHGLPRCVEMGWLPPAGDPAGDAAAEWLAGDARPLPASAVDALAEHFATRWRAMAMAALGFQGPASFALALMLAKRSGAYCEVDEVGFAGRDWTREALDSEPELMFDSEEQAFVTPLVRLQRKGGDSGGPGADDFQIKIDVVELASRLPAA